VRAGSLSVKSSRESASSETFGENFSSFEDAIFSSVEKDLTLSVSLGVVELKMKESFALNPTLDGNAFCFGNSTFCFRNSVFLCFSSSAILVFPQRPSPSVWSVVPHKKTRWKREESFFLMTRLSFCDERCQERSDERSMCWLYDCKVWQCVAIVSLLAPPDLAARLIRPEIRHYIGFITRLDKLEIKLDVMLDIRDFDIVFAPQRSRSGDHYARLGGDARHEDVEVVDLRGYELDGVASTGCPLHLGILALDGIPRRKGRGNLRQTALDGLGDNREIIRDRVNTLVVTCDERSEEKQSKAKRSESRKGLGLWMRRGAKRVYKRRAEGC